MEAWVRRASVLISCNGMFLRSGGFGGGWGGRKKFFASWRAQEGKKEGSNRGLGGFWWRRDVDGDTIMSKRGLGAPKNAPSAVLGVARGNPDLQNCMFYDCKTYIFHFAPSSLLDVLAALKRTLPGPTGGSRGDPSGAGGAQEVPKRAPGARKKIETGPRLQGAPRGAPGAAQEPPRRHLGAV